MKPVLLLAAAACLAPMIASAAELAGTWKFESFGPKGGSSAMTCKLAGSGASISGPCVTAQGTTINVSGTVSGDQVEIGYDMTGSPLHVTFKGVIQPDASIKGNATVTVAIPPMTFVGTRQ